MAAQGITSRKYTWGNKFEKGKAFYSENTNGKPVKVIPDKGDVSYYGVYNLAGNVSEFTRDDWSKSLAANLVSGFKVHEDSSAVSVVVKGGSFHTSKLNHLEINHRTQGTKGTNNDHDWIGFRIILNLPEVK